nr:MAG TPA: Major capsid protein [Microviridae sp.]
MRVNNVNHYVKLPRVSDRRFTQFKIPHGLHTTFNAGKLVPIYCKEVYPNTRIKLNWRTVTRLLTPKYPTMDNANLDVFFFFVPNIEIWDKWKNFMGENDTDYWTEKGVYQVPQQSVPLYTANDISSSSVPCRGGVGDLADYLGVPIVKADKASTSPVVSVSALPFRAYVKIWNDWFRDENFQEPCKLTLGNNSRDFPLSSAWANQPSDYVSRAELGAELCPVDKYKDYFTSLLPQPQKGDPVSLPLSSSSAPLVHGGTSQIIELLPSTSLAYSKSPVVASKSAGASSVVTLSSLDTTATDGNPRDLFKMDYQVDLSAVSSVTVEQLRLAFATQRFLEMSAVGGTRYVELVSYMFGANCPDEYLHRSRFLGGKSIPLNITPITQLSGSATESLGQVGAFSNTVGDDFAFDEKFEEHGFIMGLVCVRTAHSYSQGLPKFFMKKQKLDYYFPIFAHLGEQPVYNKEIYLQGNAEDDEVIGYQMAWDELRHTPTRSSGYLRMGAPGALEQWTYADKFDSLPVLGAAFIEETKDNIARTLSVTEYTHQFISDWFFNEEVYQILPADSTPKLVG